MTNFESLHQKFTITVKRINVLLSAGKDSPWLRKEIARFEREVVEPMDIAWAGMGEREKQEFEDRI